MRSAAFALVLAAAAASAAHAQRQLRELATLYDAGHLRPIIDKTFPFDQTLQALPYVEQGRGNGKVVITID